MADKLRLIDNPTIDELIAVLCIPKIVVGLAGPPGIGKTTLCYAVAKRMKKKYVGKVQFHSELSPNEIMGIPVGENWLSSAGDLAYTQGGMLILDEIDKASGPTKTYCYALLDMGPGGTIDYIGRQFKQQKGYQPIATCNVDPRDGSLDEALLDRFDAWFVLTEPLPMMYKLLDPDLQILCRKSYAGAADPLAGPAFTFRMFLSLQKMRGTLPLDKALLGATYGDQKLARSMQEAILLQDDGEYDEEDDEDEDGDEDGIDEEEEEEDDEEYEEDEEDEDDEDDEDDGEDE